MPSQETNTLALYTSAGEPIPMMERSKALAQGLIPSRASRNTKPLYDLELTLPCLLSSERNILIHACDNLAQGNRKYLVVYEQQRAQIYTSTSLRETAPQLTQEDRNDITQLFSEHVSETSGLSIQSEEELQKLAG